ncbi:TetR family transcriptional regulator [Streptomyces sp. SLBN-118]|uniref:TetR/AcrR family transcriptional regulator C-terminal domain-containing protein n=1 Tax=Streptomyces sp. SLBN-118 TaxID=2768454 RepID=UPI00117570C9|nr:TetR/AcrR family transcriptional regulator C-terminal domain-containing protein [Streptomyces sp. SLBN-118]TQK52977.1 TetR family transcriptional regulator [Streptomyces sp. SLBN-118]
MPDGRSRQHPTERGTSAPGAEREPREPLSRERIVEAALKIIDDEGVEALSMRRIATTLGVQAMSLYNHVGGKADVLDGVTEFITRDMQLSRSVGGGWEDGIRSVAHAFRRASLRHPRACELVLTRQLSSPGALPTINCSLAVLLDHGFEEAAAVHALRLLIAFQVGSLLREFHSPSVKGEDESAVRERTEHLVNSGFPAVAKLAPKLAVIDHDAEFTFGVELLIDALRPYAPKQD